MNFTADCVTLICSTLSVEIQQPLEGLIVFFTVDLYFKIDQALPVQV